MYSGTFRLLIFFGVTEAVLKYNLWFVHACKIPHTVYEAETPKERYQHLKIL
jgi:hypothetical protein